MLSRRARILIGLGAVIGSGLVGVILFVFAAMSDGMCHCSRSMYSLFPYSTIMVMNGTLAGRAGEYLDIFVVLVQYPLYATLLVIVRPLKWKAVVLVLILAVHITAASWGLRNHYHARGTSSMIIHAIDGG